MENRYRYGNCVCFGQEFAFINRKEINVERSCVLGRGRWKRLKIFDMFEYKKEYDIHQ